MNKSLSASLGYSSNELPIVSDFLYSFTEKYQTPIKYLHFDYDKFSTAKELLQFYKDENIEVIRNGYEFLKDLPLKELKSLENIDQELINYSVKDKCIKEDKLYFMPDTIDGLVMFYRKDILEELGIKKPANWNNFVDALRIIKEKKGITPFALHNLNDLKGWWAYYLLQPFLLQTGLSPEKFSEEDIIETNEWKYVISFFQTLIEEKLIHIMDEPEYSSHNENVYEMGNAAFILNGPWALSTLQKNPDILRNTGILSLKGCVNGTFIGGRFFAVLKDSENGENFVKHLLESDYYSKMSEDYKISAVNLKENNTPELVKEIQNIFETQGIPEVTISPEIQDKLGNKFGEDIKNLLK